MASTFDALVCAVAATLLWTGLGLPLARRLLPAPLALPLAPALGWAVHSAAALPIFFLLGFSRAAVLALTGLALVAALIALLVPRNAAPAGAAAIRVPAWALAGAALLALAPAVAILPKLVGDGVALAAPIFDHAKVAMIDDMARLGVPPGNPFFGEAGAPVRLAYYYLWHFSAAELAVLAGMSGWAADAGLTWFTAFASLALMMGVAVWLSGRAAAALLVLLLSFAGSLRPVLALLPSADALLAPATGFGGWIFQAAWVPQHLASASCVVLAVLLMAQLAQRGGALLIAAFVLVVVAGIESSTWVGGVTFAGIAVVTGSMLLIGAAPRQRLPFLMRAATAAVLALALAAPVLYDQVLAAATRGAFSPVVIRPFKVLGTLAPDHLRPMLDPLAYWLIHLVVEFPAIYPIGAIAIVSLLASRKLDPERKRIVLAFAAMTIVSLAIAGLLVSTIGNNNDLGWRAVLPGVFALTIFAAVKLSDWIAARRRIAVAAAIAAMLLGFIESFTIVDENVTARNATASTVFAKTPAMWAAVRRHAAPDERVANNPLFLQEVTPWPVNLSWALLSNRRSCFAGRELALAYAPLSNARRQEIDAQFIRVFNGNALPDDIRELALQYGCSVVVITAQDGAWTRDPFAGSPYYQLVETKAGEWKIYRAGARGIARSFEPPPLQIVQAFR
jgi:hypothetical protein